jgi:Zn-dependent M16 (insulinase) family peptidase
LNAFLDSLPSANAQRQTWSPEPGPAYEGLTIPAQVNYVGKGANLYKHGYRKHGSAGVIQRFLNTEYMWEHIRVKGGAYGGGGQFDSRSGVYNFYSYRDPNLLKTLDNYDAIGDYLRHVQLPADEITRSIIGTIGSIDSYRLPDAKGYTAMNRYLLGVTPEERQQTRDEVLGTTAADFKRFADMLDAVRDYGHIVVLGSASGIEAANKELDPKLTITKVL